MTTNLDIERIDRRFRVATENFMRSCFDLKANEKAFQAWFAAAVIQEFGMSRVYREIHLSKAQLRGIVGDQVAGRFAKGNEVFPDLSVSWNEDIDARSTSARAESLGVKGMLRELAVITELKVTSSTTKSTPRSHVEADIEKLAVLGEAHARSNEDQPLAVYMVILDNHRSANGGVSAKFNPSYVVSMLDRCATRLSEDLHLPTVILGSSKGGQLNVSTITRS